MNPSQRSTIAALLVAAGLATSPAAATIYTVGAVADGACSHHTLPAALLAAAAAGNDEVRLARNLAYTNETVHLTTGGRAIRSSYPAATTTAPTPRPAGGR